jgi:ABC-type transport system substrate-binding protein
VSQNLTASQLPTERNRWKGSNYGAFSSPMYDDLYDRFAVTIDPCERERVLVEALHFLAEEAPVIPIYFYGNAVIARKGLDGVGLAAPSQSAHRLEHPHLGAALNLIDRNAGGLSTLT